MLKIIRNKKSTAFKVIGIIGLMCLLFLFAGQSSAESISVFDVEAHDGAEYDGYLFKLNDGAELDNDAADIEAVNESQNLYLAPTLDDIKECTDNEGDIAYIEPDYKVYITDDLITEISFSYVRQGNLYSTRALAILNSDLSAEGATVGVVDTGLYTEHEDIDEAYVTDGGDYVLVQASALKDNMGHGTSVTSVIAATSDNDRGLISLGYGASIVPMKVDYKGALNASAIIRAVYSAVNTHHCDVLNMSFGYYGELKSMEEACQYAYDNGVILIASTGNEDTSEVLYPAGYDTVIGVGCDSPKVNYNHNSSIFISAPGYQITVASNSKPSAYNYYASGTSVSAPFISALAALARGYDSDISIEEFKEILKNSSVDIGEPGYDEYFGWGSIDCCQFYYNLTGKEAVPFIDVDSDYWGAQDIGYCYRNYITQGTTETTYSPENNITRCDFITMLGRMYKAETGSLPDYKCSFSDVPADHYYAEYVAWAEHNGIVDGFGDGTFAPYEPITREQAAAILYRYAEYKGATTPTNMSVLDKYADSSSISSYALDPMAWAVENGIFLGVSTNAIAPNGNLTRAMGASVFTRSIDG